MTRTYITRMFYMYCNHVLHVLHACFSYITRMVYMNFCIDCFFYGEMQEDMALHQKCFINNTIKQIHCYTKKKSLQPINKIKTNERVYLGHVNTLTTFPTPKLSPDSQLIIFKNEKLP